MYFLISPMSALGRACVKTQIFKKFGNTSPLPRHEIVAYLSSYELEKFKLNVKNSFHTASAHNCLLTCHKFEEIPNLTDDCLGSDSGPC